MAQQKRQLSTDNAIVDSYIVRIYRRTAGRDGDSGTLVGLVEEVYTDGERHPFHNISELWDILGTGGVAVFAAHRDRHSSSGHGGHSP